MLNIRLLRHSAHLELCIPPESCRQGKLCNPICAHGTLILSLNKSGDLCQAQAMGLHQQSDLYIQLWVHKLGFMLNFVSGAKRLIWLQRVLPILNPMTQPAGALAVCGVDRCFILEFGMTVQRNKVTQGQILVNSDVESKVNCISRFFYVSKEHQDLRRMGKLALFEHMGGLFATRLVLFSQVPCAKGTWPRWPLPRLRGWGRVPSGEICGGRNCSSPSLPTIAICFSPYSERGG